MASPEPLALCFAGSELTEASSVVQVLDSNDPLAGAALSPSESNTSDEEPRASGTSGRRAYFYSEELRSHWNMRKIITQLNTPAQCIAFAEENRLLPTKKMCTYHKKPMSLNTSTSSGQAGIFRCRKSNCRTRTSSRSAGTWFENARLSIELQFLMMYMFCHKYSYQQAKLEMYREDRDTVLSTRTISDWYSSCREAVVIYELMHQDANGKIGGPGKIVHLDQSKCGKRKYNKGTHLEDYWVLSMIENGKVDLRLEVCPDHDRFSEMMVLLVQKHVEEGTEIHTDFWRAYDCLHEYGYIHKKVYRGDTSNFVASDGTQTQRIERDWRFLKVMFRRNVFQGNFTDWLFEYCWRRKIKLALKDVFQEMIKVIQFVYKID